MKRLIQTIRNISKIEDLRKRILYTLGILLIYRLGSQVVIPGIDPHMLANLKGQSPDRDISFIGHVFWRCIF